MICLFFSTLEAHRRLRQLHLNNGVIVRTAKPRYATETAEVILVPTSLRQRFLYAAHDAPAAGYFGISKTLARLGFVAYWQNMANDIAEYCHTCDKCQQSKPPTPTPAPLQPFPIGRPWERVSIDILEIPMSRHGNKYLLVLQDSFTKWLEALPMKDQTATTVARKLTAVFCRFGIPETLHSDHGATFESETLRLLLNNFGIKKTRTTPYHPQSDGLVERANRTLLQLFRTYMVKDADWEDHLLLMLYAYRTAKHASTGASPFTLMFGREAKTISARRRYQINGTIPVNIGTIHWHKPNAKRSSTIAQHKRHRRFWAATHLWIWYPRRGKFQPQWRVGWTISKYLSPTTVQVRRDDRQHKSHRRRHHADRSQRKQKSTRNFQPKAESTTNKMTIKKYEDFICARTRVFYAKRGRV
ncbi:Retrovirus-related Pol polyprotein from transposon [Trichinella murrelli]|uniref:RNA-directed DNA polymerase n=1 Tax=Trichinella murrelli TaxID=144512 RepID=A0A0V0UA36_9BILA|nr:Retrovirus-related Pol polyprotein from transposon [Trichinella murrelli]